jgi:hypothetical protein
MPKQACGAKTRSGGKCHQPAMDNGRCRLHGGLTPKGIAAGAFKTGRYSKYLPQGLIDAYETTVNDPELLSVRQDIHLLDTLIASKIPLLENNDSAATWDRIDKLIRDIRKAYKNEDYGGIENSISEIEGIADQKRLFYATEQEIKSDLALRSRLVETENKTLYNKEKALTAEQAMLIMSALLDSVKRNVNDRDVLNTIQADFIRLVGSVHQRQFDSGSTEG